MSVQHEPQPGFGGLTSLYFPIYWAALGSWLCVPKLAHAYIGVTLSTGALIIIALLIFSIFLALYVLVWFPIKRRMRRRSSALQSTLSTNAHDSSHDHGDEE